MGFRVRGFRGLLGLLRHSNSRLPGGFEQEEFILDCILGCCAF